MSAFQNSLHNLSEDPGILEENGQLFITEDHQSESTESESESGLEQ